MDPTNVAAVLERFGLELVRLRPDLPLAGSPERCLERTAPRTRRAACGSSKDTIPRRRRAKRRSPPRRPSSPPGCPRSGRGGPARPAVPSRSTGTGPGRSRRSCRGHPSTGPPTRSRAGGARRWPIFSSASGPPPSVLREATRPAIFPWPDSSATSSARWATGTGRSSSASTRPSSGSSVTSSRSSARSPRPSATATSTP